MTIVSGQGKDLGILTSGRQIVKMIFTKGKAFRIYFFFSTQFQQQNSHLYGMRILLLLFLIISIEGQAQGFIGKSKQRVRKVFMEYAQTKRILINETDSSFHVMVRDSAFKPVDFVYLFDDGECNTEVRFADCDSCIQKYLSETLADQNWGWKKVNEKQFLSKSSKRLLLELPDDAGRSAYIIRRVTRKEYTKLLAN
jgi:hypothetical protein